MSLIYGLFSFTYLGKMSKHLCLLLTLVSFVPAAYCKEVHQIKLGAFEYPPIFSKQSDKIHGIGVDLGNELFNRLNLETELTIYPFKRALLYVQQGRLDGIIALVKTKDRENYLIYSRPHVQANGYIYSAANRVGGAVNFEHLEDLRPYRVGVTIGYSYGRNMDAFLASMDTDSAPQEYNTFKKLILNRVDIVPAADIIVKNLIKKHPEFKGKFVQSDKSFYEAAFHMGVSKKSRLAQMMPLINKTITEMEEDGLIDKIIKKYTE